MITLEKAIEIQTIHNDHNPNFTDAERREAHNLSIEAMKRVQDCRQVECDFAPELLPGEAKE